MSDEQLKEFEFRLWRGGDITEMATEAGVTVEEIRAALAAKKAQS